MNQELSMSAHTRVSRFLPIDARKLRSLRIQLGWTQGDLARIAGYSERLIRKAEASGTLSIITIRDIAEALSSCGRTITVDELTLDLLAIAQQFLHSYDSHGKAMVYRCEHLLAEHFVFCNSAQNFDAMFSGSWSGIEGLQQFADLFFANFDRQSNSLEPTFQYLDSHVSARYVEMLTYRGRELPVVVNLKVQFKKGLICHIEQECRAFGSWSFNVSSEFPKAPDCFGNAIHPESRCQ